MPGTARTLGQAISQVGVEGLVCVCVVGGGPGPGRGWAVLTGCVAWQSRGGAWGRLLCHAVFGGHSAVLMAMFFL